LVTGFILSKNVFCVPIPILGYSYIPVSELYFLGLVLAFGLSGYKVKVAFTPVLLSPGISYSV
jgi:hypothetical protein